MEQAYIDNNCEMPAEDRSTDTMLHGDAAVEALVMYRVPHERRYTVLKQLSAPRILQSLFDLPLSGGYVIAPFVVTEASPILFVTPDSVENHPLKWPVKHLCDSCGDDSRLQREHYTASFGAAHQRLEKGELQKMVLSRRLNVKLKTANAGGKVANDDLQQLFDAGRHYFLKACHYRPNSFVAFWWTRKSGAWLVATPEPLIEKRQYEWGTVALAGTLPWTEGKEPQWNDKNIEEQAIVSRFVESQLQRVTRDIEKSVTYSLRTGNIQHLCTDFRFGIDDVESVRELLVNLHPTPAVCGLPRAEALKAILQDEKSPRRYYAGFSGPLLMDGETRLYVSLRCMSFTCNAATLYAGGGIMPDSCENEEWEETQRKLQTMLQLL